MSEQEKKKFRLQAQRIFFTYKYHWPKDSMKELFSNILKRKIKWIRCAHENGDEYPHTHILIELEKKCDITNCRFADLEINGEVIHPHIKTLQNGKAFADCKIYISKEDPENADLKPQPNIYNKVNNCKTIDEAMNLAKTPGEALGLKTMYEISRKQKPKRFNYEPNKEWQQQLLEIVDPEPTCRKIIWIYDKTGNTGKTALAKWLYLNSENDWLITKDMGTSRDAATIIQNGLAQGWTQKGLILDLPRSAENHKRIYGYLEEICDGLITATKYQGRALVFDTPHTVVFANWPPMCWLDEQTRTLSKDRWNIWEIVDDKLEKRSPSKRPVLNNENTFNGYI